MDKSEAHSALAALAHDRGLAVYRVLMQAGPVGADAGEIAARLDLPAATLSFHLNQLRHAGLIAVRREGRSLIYATEYAAMNALLDYLTENCGQGGASALPVAEGCGHEAQACSCAG